MVGACWRRQTAGSTLRFAPDRNDKTCVWDRNDKALFSGLPGRAVGGGSGCAALTTRGMGHSIRGLKGVCGGFVFYRSTTGGALLFVADVLDPTLSSSSSFCASSVRAPRT